MEKQHKIIITILIAIIIITSAAIIATQFLTPQIKYETINISNGTTIDAPSTSDANWEKNETGIKVYTCQSKKVSMFTFNSEEDLNLVGAGAFAIVRDALLSNAKDVENYNGYQIKENNINKTTIYLVGISNNTTHDNIVIGAADINILKHMLDTLHFGAPNKTVNATVNETEPEPTPEPTSTPNKTNKTNNNDEYLYGGESKEEYYYKQGLADGHREAAEALSNEYDYDSYYEEEDKWEAQHMSPEDAAYVEKYGMK